MSTHLDDDEYEEFLAKEFDADGRLKGDPRVGWFIGLGIVLLAVLAVMVLL